MNRKRGFIVGAVVLAVAWVFLMGPWVGDSEGAEGLSRRYYENKQFGFKFRTFAKWTGFPPEPKDKVTIVHFRTGKADRGMGYDPHGFVALLTMDGCESVHDYLDEERRYMGVTTAKKMFMPPKMLPEGAVQFLVNLTGQGCAGTGLAVEYKRENDSIAVIYTCERRQLKKYKRAFIMSFATFKFIEKDEGGSLENPTGEETAIEKRFRELQASKAPGWNIVKIPYYIIYYNCDNKDLYAVINRLKMIRPQYQKYFPPLNQEFVDNAAPIVRVCKSQRDFMTYSGMPGGVGGYWSPGVEELVVFRKSTYLSMKKLFFGILQHEGFHQYIFYACGGVSPCICFNEGPAEFFNAFVPRGGRMVPTLDLQMRKTVIKPAVGQGSHLPLKTILRYTQGQYYNNSSLCYAQGWTITSFLQLGRQYLGARFKKEWGEIMPKYFDVLQDEVKKAYEKTKGKKGEIEEGSERETFGHLGSAVKRTKILKKAMDKCLEGIDLEELEKAWVFFVKKII